MMDSSHQSTSDYVTYSSGGGQNVIVKHEVGRTSSTDELRNRPDEYESDDEMRQHNIGEL